MEAYEEYYDRTIDKIKTSTVRIPNESPKHSPKQVKSKKISPKKYGDVKVTVVTESEDASKILKSNPDDVPLHKSIKKHYGNKGNWNMTFNEMLNQKRTINPYISSGMNFKTIQEESGTSTITDLQMVKNYEDTQTLINRRKELEQKMSLARNINTKNKPMHLTTQVDYQYDDDNSGGQARSPRRSPQRKSLHSNHQRNSHLSPGAKTNSRTPNQKGMTRNLSANVGKNGRKSWSRSPPTKSNSKKRVGWYD